MRIFHLVTSGDVAGGQLVALQLARAARARGDDIAFVSPTEGPFLDLARAEGFRSFQVRSSRLYELRGALALARLLRRERADVLHTHTHLAASILGRLAARGAGAAVVSHLHIENHFRPQALPRAVSRTLDNATARLCARLVAVSDATRESFEAQGFPRERMETVHNGISLDGASPSTSLRSDLGIPADAVLVAHVGRLAPVKGQRELIAALAHAPRVHAVLVGEDLETSGAYRSELEADAEWLGVADRVVFAGYRAAAAAELAEVDALVLPSHVEGLPVVILEAMARAKPVIATPVGGTAELVVDRVTGILVPPGDVEALSGALAWLAEHADEARQLGEAGRRRVEEDFSEEAMTRRVLEVYDDAVRR
jgi:glycosyltransferase involved in cell wall biosynthesis